MGRKRRMKSTFINTVTVGSLWICHTTHNIVDQHTLRLVEKNTISVTLEVNTTIFAGLFNVKAFSTQQDLDVYETSLEDFFLYYRKLP